MLNVWFFIFILSALLDWIALRMGWKKVNYFSKPAALLALIAWFTSLGGWQISPIWFGLALVFSLLGDIFLLLADKFLLLGLVVFLLAHAAYVLGFAPPSATPPLPTLVFSTVVFLMGCSLYNKLHKAIENKAGFKKLRATLLLYSLALCLMLFSTLLTLAQAQWLPAAAILVACGGMLFFTSDSLWVHNRFIHPLPNAKLLVRITYHMAHLALVAGILLNFLKR